MQIFSLYSSHGQLLLKARLNSTLIPGKRSLRYPLSLRRFLWDLGCHIEIRREAFETFNVDRPFLFRTCVFVSYIQQSKSRLRESRVVLSLPVMRRFTQHFDEGNGRMFSRLAGVGDVEAGALARLVRGARRARPLRERQIRRFRHSRGN